MTFVDKLLKDQRECRCNNCADCTIANLKLDLEAERAAHAKTRGERDYWRDDADTSMRCANEMLTERDAALKELAELRKVRDAAKHLSFEETVDGRFYIVGVHASDRLLAALANDEEETKRNDPR